MLKNRKHWFKSNAPEENVNQGTLALARAFDLPKRTVLRKPIKRRLGQKIRVDDEHAQWIKNRRLLDYQDTADMNRDNRLKMEHARDFAIYHDVPAQIDKHLDINPLYVDPELLTSETLGYNPNRPATEFEKEQAVQDSDLYQLLHRFFQTRAEQEVRKRQEEEEKEEQKQEPQTIPQVLGDLALGVAENYIGNQIPPFRPHRLLSRIYGLS